MNITFGLLRSPDIQAIHDKQQKKRLLVENALRGIERFHAELQAVLAVAAG